MSIVKLTSQIVYKFSPNQLKEIIAKDMDVSPEHINLEFNIQKVADGPLQSNRVKDDVVEIEVTYNPKTK